MAKETKCRNCGGTGDGKGYPYRGACSICRGTGRVPRDASNMAKGK